MGAAVVVVTVVGVVVFIDVVVTVVDVVVVGVVVVTVVGTVVRVVTVVVVQLPNDDTELPGSGTLNCFSSAFVLGLDRSLSQVFVGSTSLPLTSYPSLLPLLLIF